MSQDIQRVEKYDVPDHIRDSEVQGVEDLRQFIIPPRLKVVQKMAGEQLLANFKIGDALLVPHQFKVASLGESFTFVPLFFYPEWITINPIQMRGSLPMIRERSFDPKGIIALKARSPERREEPLEENPKFSVRHAECLNFLCMIDGDSPASGQPVMMSFAKGEWFHGSKFASLIATRKASIYGCRFEATPVERPPNPQGYTWFGLDVQNPLKANPWVDNDLYASYQMAHMQLKGAHAKQLIRADYEDIEEADPAAETGF